MTSKDLLHNFIITLYNGQVEGRKVDGTRHLKCLIGTRVHLHFFSCCVVLLSVMCIWIEKKEKSVSGIF